MRVRRRAKERLEPLSEAVTFHLLTGRYPEREQFETCFEVWFLTTDQKRELWQEHRAELLDEWTTEHPGSRPWAWWYFEALEPRRCVSGATLLLPKHAPTDWEWCWRENFGIPGFVQCRPRGFDGYYPEVESQAAYLDRHRLLTRPERSRLGDDAFEPEPIDPFLTYEGELGELRARGQAQHAVAPRAKPATKPRTEDTRA